MALQKNIELNNGVTCSYHKISEIQLYPNQNISVFKLESYLNQTARNKNKLPLNTEVFRLEGSDNNITVENMDSETKNPYVLAYESIKSIAIWNDSIDV